MGDVGGQVPRDFQLGEDLNELIVVDPKHLVKLSGWSQRSATQNIKELSFSKCITKKEIKLYGGRFLITGMRKDDSNEYLIAAYFGYDVARQEFKKKIKEVTK